MTTLALLLLGAAAGSALARFLRIPVIPVLIILGMVTPLLGARQDADTLRSIFELGLIFLVFVAGTELAPKRVEGRRKGAVAVGLAQFFMIGAAGLGLSLLMGFDAMTSLYIGLALSASSTLVVVRHLKDRQQMFEPFGRLVTGVLFLQDLLIIVGIVVLLRLPGGLGEVVVGLGGLATLALLALVSQRWLMPRLVLHGNLGEEEKLLVVLAQLFLFMGIGHALGVPLVAGAFLAGVGLSSFPLNGVARGLLWPLSEFFLAVFFFAMGAIIQLPTGAGLVQALILAAFVLVVTPPLVTFLAEKQGFSARASIESGLLLSQTSEFSLIIALSGMMLGIITPEVFSIIGLVTVVTMVLTPFLATDAVTRALLQIHPSRRGKTERLVLDNHVLLLGYGSTGNRLLKALRDNGKEVVVVDEDAVVVARLRAEGVPCLRGDGSDPNSLRQIRARRAQAIVCSLRRFRDAENVLAYVEESRPKTLVRVFDDAAADRVKELGGVPIRSDEAAVDSFMEWFQATLGGTEPPPASASAEPSLR
jgi:CPA2 family monovalent cation:H+ antiporter-2